MRFNPDVDPAAPVTEISAGDSVPSGYGIVGFSDPSKLGTKIQVKPEQGWRMRQLVQGAQFDPRPFDDPGPVALSRRVNDR